MLFLVPRDSCLPVPHLFVGQDSQLFDLPLSYLVGAGLAWQGDVPAQVSYGRGSPTFRHRTFCRRPTFDTSTFRHFDILTERHFDTLTFCRRDILPPGHCVAETFCHPDIMSPRHFDTSVKKDILLPKTNSHPDVLPPIFFALQKFHCCFLAQS